MPTLGEKIREARVQRGLTQGELAHQFVTSSMISQIEADRAKPSYQLLKVLAERLGLDLNYFMSDMDAQYALSSNLKIAQYHLFIDEPKQALKILEEMEKPDGPGLNFNEYLRLLTIVRRRMGQMIEAVHLVEKLREIAYRAQDMPLLLQVHKESGYIEYDMKNYKGAMHEWKNAVSVGEALLADTRNPRSSIHSELRELFLTMCSAASDAGDEARAADCLAKAVLHFDSTVSLRDIADGYIEDAKRSLETDNLSNAPTLADRALITLQAARIVEQSILLQAKAGRVGRLNGLDARNSGASPVDPWNESARATVASNPQGYLESEFTLIEGLEDDGAYDEAMEKVSQGRTMLNDIIGDNEGPDWALNLSEKFSLKLAEIMYARGDVDAAIALLESMLDSDRYLSPGCTRMAYALLIEWNVGLERIDRVTFWTGHLQKWIEKGLAFVD